MPSKTRLPIERKPLFEYDDVLSRYWHPNGWVITQHERTWSERVGAVRGQATAGPKRWWEVRRRNRRTRSHPETFLTLREAERVVRRTRRLAVLVSGQDRTAATTAPHDLRLAWAFNDPGVVHLARYGTEETLCGKDALGVNIGRRAVTCVACKEQTL